MTYITTLRAFNLLMVFFISRFRSMTNVGIKMYVPLIVKFAILAAYSIIAQEVLAMIPLSEVTA